MRPSDESAAAASAEAAAIGPIGQANSAEAGPRRLPEALSLLARRAQVGDLTLGQAVDELGATSPWLICALLALPFCQPVPTVGLSIPFGVGIACLSLQTMLDRPVSLPQVIARRRVPRQLFPLLLRVTARFAALSERLIRPRGQWMFSPPLGRLWALVLIINALCLSLPLPIPLSNTFPAASVLGICLGSLHRDGLTVAFGLSVFAAALGFLAFLAWASAALMA